VSSSIDDAGFLRSLFDFYSTGQYAHDSVESGDLGFSDQWAVVTASGAADQHDLQAFTDAYDEATSFENTFKGEYVEALRADALSMCGAHEAALEHVHVGVVPRATFNSQAVPTPSGNEVIVLNHTLLAIIPLVVKCIMAIATRNTSEPYATGASQAAFAEALAGLARVAVSGDTRELGIDVGPLHCFDPYELRAQRVSFSIQLFMLLHEFGHIAIDRRRVVVQPTTSALSEQQQAWRDEFAADEFAVSRMLAGRFNKGDVAFAAGCLIGLLLVCESLPQSKLDRWSHPSALARWQRIKRLTAFSELGADSPAYYLDDIVGFVIGQAHMATLHRQLVQLMRRQNGLRTRSRRPREDDGPASFSETGPLRP
jgi:hypothetical protein